MYDTVDRKDLEAMIANKEDFGLIEVLDEEEYKRNYLKEAIDIPLSRLGKEVKERFDLDQELVVYCADIDCQASSKTAQNLERRTGEKSVIPWSVGLSCG